MSNFRPKDWKGIRLDSMNEVVKGMGGGFDEDYFEAGADAMLEALNKNRVTIPDIIYFLTKGKGEGHLVLIPDQKPLDGCNSEES